MLEEEGSIIIWICCWFCICNHIVCIESFNSLINSNYILQNNKYIIKCPSCRFETNINKYYNILKNTNKIIKSTYNIHNKFKNLLDTKTSYILYNILKKIKNINKSFII